MSKITSDGLTRSSTGCSTVVPYDSSGHQRVKSDARPRNNTVTIYTDYNADNWLSYAEMFARNCREIHQQPIYVHRKRADNMYRSSVGGSPLHIHVVFKARRRHVVRVRSTMITERYVTSQ